MVEKNKTTKYVLLIVSGLLFFCMMTKNNIEGLDPVDCVTGYQKGDEKNPSTTCPEGCKLTNAVGSTCTTKDNPDCHGLDKDTCSTVQMSLVGGRGETYEKCFWNEDEGNCTTKYPWCATAKDNSEHCESSQIKDGDQLCEFTEGVEETCTPVISEEPVDCVESTADRSTCTRVGQDLWTVTTQPLRGGNACTGTPTLCKPGDGTIECPPGGGSDTEPCKCPGCGWWGDFQGPDGPNSKISRFSGISDEKYRNINCGCYDNTTDNGCDNIPFMSSWPALRGGPTCPNRAQIESYNQNKEEKPNWTWENEKDKVEITGWSFFSYWIPLVIIILSVVYLVDREHQQKGWVAVIIIVTLIGVGVARGWPPWKYFKE